MSVRALSVVSLAVIAVGCSARKIPGTELDDTDDTRAILDVMERYRLAVEQRDAAAIVDLADASFKDDGGSATPDDDLDYRDLSTKLPERLKRLDEVRLELTVRKIEFTEDQAGARATYTYNATFRMPGLTSRAQNESEIKQMIFKRIDKRVWKIVSGV